MQIVFGTIERASALEYLQKALPFNNITAETAKPILDLVSAQKIRIGDPLMYGGKAPVYPEKNCTDDDRKIVMDWYESLS